MDLLDKYKKTWENQPEEGNKFSAVDIYKMAKSKSSSIVKWIFIIGIIEFIGLNSMYFFIDLDEAYAEYKKIGLEKFIYISNILFYIVILYFLIKFYLNYKKISTSDSTKVLMKKILKTRKTVRNYVLFNLVFMALLTIIVIVAEINFKSEELETKQIFLIILLTLVVTLVLLGVLWLFYQLLYGILLKKLNRNYKELAKLDENN
jgi:Na+/proline symporter